MRITLLGFFLVIALSFGIAQKQKAPKHHAGATAQRKPAAVAVPKAGGANGTEAQLKHLEQQTAKAVAAKPQKGNAAAVKIKAQPVGPNKNAPIAFKAQPAQAKGGGKPAGPRTHLRGRH